MEKQCLYLGKTEQGVFAQALFGSAGAFEKTAGAPPLLIGKRETTYVVSSVPSAGRIEHVMPTS